MDSDRLFLDVNYVGSSGVVLNTEQRAALQTSLVILRSQHKFSKVCYWGKVNGVKDDYFIAQGTQKDQMKQRKTFYSQDCMTWSILPEATEELRKKTGVIKGRFIGDASHEYEHTEIKKSADDGTEEETTVRVKEEDRLSSVIADIDDDVAVVPRGAFKMTPEGDVVLNRNFQGLSSSEAAKLCSYYHFRPAYTLNEKSLIEREKAELDKALDFMDNIEEDVPKGCCWSLQMERGGAQATLRSLLWPGLTAFHIPGTPQFGYIYVGLGEKNNDLPFMY